MKRNDFFKLALAAGIGSKSVFAQKLKYLPEGIPGPLPRRPLGKTGEKLSIIAFGGNIIKGEEQPEADRMVREAYEAGVNYFDVAPAYGNAEVLMGPPLEPFREKIFLSCKTQKRDRAGSQAELEQSLRRLHTDYFDLYQHHYLNSKEDIDKVFGPNGAMETLVRAKEKGQARYLGFSAHTVEAAFAAMDHFDFDTIMLPLHYTSWYKGNFGPQVLEKALGKNMGIIAIKPGACCPRERGEVRDEYKKCWYRPFKTEEEIARSYYFTLSLPVTAAIPPQEEKLFKLAVKVAHAFIPLAESEKEELRKEALKGDSIFKYPAWPV
ncbi:MAG TPA: aldo/keto reductase [archaeon]|nr:aldo/keto reductase [archaeon]